MGQRIVVGDLDGELLRELPVEPAKHVFVFALAAAEHDQDEVLQRQSVRNLLDQVEAFLRDEARHDAHDRQLCIRRQTERLQQIGFAFRLAAEVRAE